MGRRFVGEPRRIRIFYFSWRRLLGVAALFCGKDRPPGGQSIGLSGWQFGDHLLPYDLRLLTSKSVSHSIDFTLIFFNRNLGDRQPHFSRHGIDQVGAIVIMEKVGVA